MALVAVLAGGLVLAQEQEAVRTDLNPKDLKRVAAVTRPTTDFSAPENFEQMQAGAATTKKIVNQDAFSFSQANLSFEQEETFKLGNALFRKVWVSAPSSTQASDGLGPLFNSRACQNCHLKDGRGHPPQGAEAAQSMFLRLSVPARTEEEKALLAEHRALVIPDPTYGDQLQEFAVPGLTAEGKMAITYKDVPVTLAGGEVVQLREPHYAIDRLAYGSTDPELMISPRVAPPMVGLGLIEAIPEADILAHADPDDQDGDGISGRPNWVPDPVGGGVALGRFGWKAGNATIRAQTASAFAGDIGIGNPLFDSPYGDCRPAQKACLEMPTGVQANLGDTEAPDPVLDLVTFYSQTLGVPQRRNVSDEQVLRGKELFYGAGCTACHTPKYVTSRRVENPAHRFQLIWPYTDLLLHDMGEGLADHRSEGEASGTEWRTSPLWGIGLTQVVSGHTLFLHDGRARNLSEAILWHGGEGQASRDAFAQMPEADRQALLSFLESL